MVPAVIYVFGPAGARARIGEWRALGSIEKVKVGTPTLFKASIERFTGWLAEEESVAVYVITEDGREFRGLSNICTHLACRVRWIEDEEVFYCPCHNGVFAKTGEVISGPPPRPLDEFELRVEGGQIHVNLEV